MNRSSQVALGIVLAVVAAGVSGASLRPGGFAIGPAAFALLLFGTAIGVRLLRFAVLRAEPSGWALGVLDGATPQALRASETPLARAADEASPVSVASAAFLALAADRTAFGVVLATALLAQVRTIGPIEVGASAALVFGAGLALALLAVARHVAIVRALEAAASRFPGHLSERTVAASGRLLEGLAPGLRPRRALILLAGTGIAWALEIVATLQSFEAVGAAVRPSQAALVLAAVHVGVAFLPACLGLGLTELLALLATHWTPPPETASLGGVILAHACAAVAASVGSVAVAAGSVARRSIDLSSTVERVAERRAIVDGLLRSQAASGSPWLSIVIPAYNEERRILPTLVSIVGYLHARAIPAEVVVVDDGSHDGTREVVRAVAADHPEVRLLAQPENRGKGAAVRAGVLASKGRWVLFDDADGATPIEEVERLLCEASRGAAVAIGSRALAAPDVRVEKKLGRVAAGRLFAFLVNLVAVPGIGDTQCGFKLFERSVADEIFPQQRLERFGFDVEILFLARRAGHRIVEVPVNWSDVQGSKVGVASGLGGFVDIFRVLWIHGRRR